MSTDPAGGPQAWSTARVDPNGDLNGISCASPSICVATDSSGNVVTSTNPAGGASAWTLTDLQDDSQSYECAKYFTSCTGGSLGDVSCPSVSVCVALDQAANIVSSANPTGGAGAWHVANVHDPNYPPGLLGIRCSALEVCVGYDGYGDLYISTDPAGPASAWSLVGGAPLQAGAFDALCPSSSLCLVDSGNGNLLTSTDPLAAAPEWKVVPLSPNDAGEGVAPVSCTPSLCLVAGGVDYGELFTSTDPGGGRTSWKLAFVDGDGHLDAGACASLSLCVLSDTAGNILVGTPAPSSAEIKSLLRRLTGMPAHAREIPVVLRRDGYRCIFRAPSAGRLVVSWSMPARRTTTATTLLATARYTFPEAGARKIKVRLTRAGRQALATATHVKLLMRARFTPTENRGTSITRRITLNRPR